jgi:hypothetical protein
MMAGTWVGRYQRFILGNGLFDKIVALDCLAGFQPSLEPAPATGLRLRYATRRGRRWRDLVEPVIELFLENSNGLGLGEDIPLEWIEHRETEQLS